MSLLPDLEAILNTRIPYYDPFYKNPIPAENPIRQNPVCLPMRHLKLNPFTALVFHEHDTKFFNPKP